MNILNRFRNKDRKQSTQDAPAPEVQTQGLKILFYKDTAATGVHGTIYADHVQMGLKKEPIGFFFQDIAEPPAMTPELLAYIFDQSKTRGWMPISLRSYATVFTVMPQPRSNVKLSQRGQPGQPNVPG